jgi:hypothetical protein
VDDDPNHEAPSRKRGLPGEIYMGIGIALVAITIVLQRVLFDGDDLSARGEALAALWFR